MVVMKKKALLILLIFSPVVNAIALNIVPQVLNNTIGNVSLVFFNDENISISQLYFNSSDIAISSVSEDNCLLSTFSFNCDIDVKPSSQHSLSFTYMANAGQHNASITLEDLSSRRFVFNKSIVVDLDRPIMAKVEVEYPPGYLAAKTGTVVILKAFVVDATSYVKKVVVDAAPIGCGELQLSKGVSYWSGICKVEAKDGVKILKAIAYDAAGNKEEKNFQVIIDNSPSKINLIHFKQASRIGETVTFTFNLSEKGTSIKDVVIDMSELGCPVKHLEASDAVYSSSCTVVSGEGHYNISIDAYDYAGNVERKLIDFFVDNHPPQINSVELKYTGKQKAAKQGDTIHILVNANDSLSGVSKVILQQNSVCSANFSYEKGVWEGLCTVEEKKSGNYKIMLLAYDQAGNVVNESINISIDNDVPESLEIEMFNSTHPINNLKNGDILSFVISAYDSQSGIQSVRVYGQGTGCDATLNYANGYWSGFCKVHRASMGPASIAIIAYDYANNSISHSIDININDSFCDKICDIGYRLNYSTCTCEKMACNKICPRGFNLNRESCTCEAPKVCNKKCKEGEKLNTQDCVCEKVKAEETDYTWVLYLGVIVVLLVPLTFALNSKMINSLKKYD
ncbi:hypothetical protein DRN74_01735 [Candidatus Micrarchaeota archaeon]|nr:MAG: hypothetical protein DRN74_01735 [Candidatus Micrarchaeota archaeon]